MSYMVFSGAVFEQSPHVSWAVNISHNSLPKRSPVIQIACQIGTKRTGNVRSLPGVYLQGAISLIVKHYAHPFICFNVLVLMLDLHLQTTRRISVGKQLYLWVFLNTVIKLLYIFCSQPFTWYQGNSNFSFLHCFPFDQQYPPLFHLALIYFLYSP